MDSLNKILQDIELTIRETKEINRKTTRNMIICLVCMCISIACLIIRLI